MIELMRVNLFDFYSKCDIYCSVMLFENCKHVIYFKTKIFKI